MTETVDWIATGTVIFGTFVAPTLYYIASDLNLPRTHLMPLGAWVAVFVRKGERDLLKKAYTHW